MKKAKPKKKGRYSKEQGALLAGQVRGQAKVQGVALCVCLWLADQGVQAQGWNLCLARSRRAV
jgi:hypothetical protein